MPIIPQIKLFTEKAKKSLKDWIPLKMNEFGQTLQYLPEEMKETAKEFKYLPKAFREPAKKKRSTIPFIPNQQLFINK